MRPKNGKGAPLGRGYSFLSSLTGPRPHNGGVYGGFQTLAMRAELPCKIKPLAVTRMYLSTRTRYPACRRPRASAALHFSGLRVHAAKLAAFHPGPYGATTVPKPLPVQA